MVTGVAASADGRFAAASARGVAIVWDVAVGGGGLRVSHKQVIKGVAFHPKRPVLATASLDGTVAFECLHGEATARGRHERCRRHREDVVRDRLHQFHAHRSLVEVRHRMIERDGCGDGRVFAAAAAAAGTEMSAAEEGEIATMPVVEQRVLDEEHQVGRNDPCWCGSGKKFKKCHGA